MYSKIALKNVKKSFKDYTIYFLTLTLAVCIFYSFNSIESQKAMLEAVNNGPETIEIITTVISYVSVFVAIILGSLILYANNFLIKKRNKELGIYMILGMGRSKISKVLIIETLIVGFLSLIIGLIIGFIASQGLSVIVAKLFEVSMSGYKFVLSMPAIGKTILYFGIIFSLVMIFNILIISKYKIIDLLTMGKKNEEIKIKNPIIYVAVFIISIVIIAVAYKLILDIGLDIENPKVLISILLGVVGTIMFFFSLSGFLLDIIKKSNSIYFKGLNIFTVRQLNSKVKTNFLSISVICLMLFITMVVLSTGLSFKKALESGLKEATPYDATAYKYFYNEKGENKLSIEDTLKETNITLGVNDRVAYFDEYEDGTRLSNIMPLSENLDKKDFVVSFVPISDYNSIRKLNNKEIIDLKENQVLITSNFAKSMDTIKGYMKNNNTITLKGKKYEIKNKELIEENFRTDFMKNNRITVIIKDSYCQGANLLSSNANIFFDDNNKNIAQNTFEKSIKEFQNRGKEGDWQKIGYIMFNTRDEIFEGNKGVTTLVLFVVIYLGIIFLISSMAVLGLQQLSEASDSAERYVSLKKIGANRKSINRTIFIQMLIYFTLPMVLAFIHSIVGIKVTSKFIETYNRPNILPAALLTSLLFIIVYGIYFYTTYIGYRNIIKSKSK